MACPYEEMKLRKIVSYIAPSLRPSQKCEACGEEFHCGASVWGCWCAQSKLTDVQRTALRAKYRNCLCRACLEKAARDEQLARPESAI